MTQLLDRLRRDHKHLSQVLLLLDDLLDRFHEGSEPDYELMCEMLEYVESYADQVHHPSEEDIFDRLRGRSNETYPVLDLLTKQHTMLVQMNKRFRQSLEGIVHEEVLLRDDVELLGREFVRALRDHLNLEEAEAFPLVRERLSASDWDELLAQSPNVDDPVFSEADQARFQSLVKHLMEQAES